MDSIGRRCMDRTDLRGTDRTATREPPRRWGVGAQRGAYYRYAEVYDRIWGRAPYDRFVDLCLEEARGPVRQVVVAACGTGNAVVELARRGYRVAGFDLSATMLAQAATKRRPEAPMGLVRADLRSAPFADGAADLVLALNTSLNYLLEAEEVVTALAHLGRIAGPDGTVVVEPLSERFLHAGFEPNRHVEEEGLSLDASYELHGDLLAEQVRWRVGEVELVETYWQRWYDDDRLGQMLAAAGLRVIARRPMWPSIPEEPSRGRTLWVLARHHPTHRPRSGPPAPPGQAGKGRDGR
jgi:SAM-dependent methyltransferase